jgi:hypothetical protein
LVHLRARVTHSTGVTRHFVGHVEGSDFVRDTELPTATCQPLDGGYYLMYLDDSLSPMTDGWHTSVEEAKAQAAAEFGIRDDEWFVVPAK